MEIVGEQSDTDKFTEIGSPTKTLVQYYARNEWKSSRGFCLQVANRNLVVDIAGRVS
jgi:hypothetical protein